MNIPDPESLPPRLGELREALAQAVVGQREVVEQLLLEVPYTPSRGGEFEPWE